MKSVIEEASTLAKAIERGWTKAGKPKDFSIKIYQEPQTNFFGITKQTAKVGIFFDSKSITQHIEKSEHKQALPRRQQTTQTGQTVQQANPSEQTQQPRRTQSRRGGQRRRYGNYKKPQKPDDSSSNK